MSANCSAIQWILVLMVFIEKPSISTPLLVEKFPTIVIISSCVHGCKNIVEVLGDGIVSVTDIGSDRDTIVLAKLGPVLTKNSLYLDAI